ncbi:MAG TPA: hypothetical protein VMY98_00960 [Anaerolineae bacterium]|nr:hypothetical protein [Anaerolineae bacterium]
MLRMPPEALADRVAGIVRYTLIKYLAKWRKEDGRTTHLLIATTSGSRRLLDREVSAEEDGSSKTVERLGASAVEDDPFFTVCHLARGVATVPRRQTAVEE